MKPRYIKWAEEALSEGNKTAKEISHHMKYKTVSSGGRYKRKPKNFPTDIEIGSILRGNKQFEKVEFTGKKIHIWGLVDGKDSN